MDNIKGSLKKIRLFNNFTVTAFSEYFAGQVTIFFLTAFNLAHFILKFTMLQEFMLCLSV